MKNPTKVQKYIAGKLDDHSVESADVLKTCRKGQFLSLIDGAGFSLSNLPRSFIIKNHDWNRSMAGPR